jgi:hypothetical protein
MGFVNVSRKIGAHGFFQFMIATAGSDRSPIRPLKGKHILSSTRSRQTLACGQLGILINSTGKVQNGCIGSTSPPLDQPEAASKSPRSSSHTVQRSPRFNVFVFNLHFIVGLGVELRFTSIPPLGLDPPLPLLELVKMLAL